MQEHSTITYTPRGCVYCNDASHKSSQCTFISSPAERRNFPQGKRLCFNCIGPHRVAHCRSRGNCTHCKQRHHTSICDRQVQTATSDRAALTATHVGEKACHPVVIVKANGVKWRALLDTGATGSYISAFLVTLLKVKVFRSLTRGIKTIMGLVSKRVETYDVKISDTKRSAYCQSAPQKLISVSFVHLRIQIIRSCGQCIPISKACRWKNPTQRKFFPSV